MKLENNKCYMLLRKGDADKLIFLFSVDFCRTVDGNNRFTISYSEIYGGIETCVDFENIEYIYEVAMTDTLKQRLIDKWGKDTASYYGIEVEAK